MPNANGWLSRDEVKRINVPVLVPDKETQRGRWHNGNPPGGGILLSRTRCAALLCPVAADESPAAFMYSPKHRSEYRYAPFYFRTTDQIHSAALLPKESEVLNRSELHAANGI
ncbi:hypothetical protein UY286_08735 [Paenibacillus polymyxa]|uniref:hypothetical protein n=1 Tax=Paenibacillus polymyxa TaxID=1406 RepID=UPI002AB42283|nr:hypothetical protein [Paenibacillus polymyxa]MDY7990665.1 hypothetical protein [Paenibacillus polymyxa]MDY8117524.1 hypothetical protein [Paenibacillus polymyxa]